MTCAPVDPRHPGASGRAPPLRQMRKPRLRELEVLVLGPSTWHKESPSTPRHAPDVQALSLPKDRHTQSDLGASLNPFRVKQGNYYYSLWTDGKTKTWRIRCMSYGPWLVGLVQFTKHLLSTSDVSVPLLGLGEQKRTRKGSLPLRRKFGDSVVGVIRVGVQRTVGPHIEEGVLGRLPGRGGI